MSRSSARDRSFDAVVIGAGPNGLAAGITLAEAGWRVCIFEGRSEIGGGARSAQLTLPGYVHDVCSAFHPLGLGSPFFRVRSLERFGLQWVHADYPLAHPLDDRPAAVMYRSVDETAAALGVDGPRYVRLVGPLVTHADELLEEILGPLRLPRRPRLLARFGLRASLPASFWINSYFRDGRAKALFAGNAAHVFLPLSRVPSGAVGLVLTLCAHAYGWPMARGGSGAIAAALAAYFKSLGGTIVTDAWIRSLRELPPARAILCAVAPRSLAHIAGDLLPERFRQRLTAFRHGPAAYKMDWVLDGPIPWADPRCARAATVHLGGTAAEIMDAEQKAFAGEMPPRPFVLVGQQSTFDPTRAASGGTTVWAYAHVPHAYAGDAGEGIELQIERFAPGFRRRILHRVQMRPTAWEEYNPNIIGGDIVGGISNLTQLFARPVHLRRPYATPNPRIFICSASTPPGAGVHGMCGWHAAQAVLKTHARKDKALSQ